MHDIRDYNAKGDGTTINTKAIQKAIDDCSANGGGLVLIAGGDFVTGTLFFRDNVVLRVEGGARLLGSLNIEDYSADTHKNMYKNEPHMDRALLFARDVEGIGIEGNGIIDGRGQEENFPSPGDPQKNRPMMIRFVNCRRIRMRDITLHNPAAWTSAWLYCEDIVVDGITIHSRVNSNGDGLDFDGCRNVRVSNSSFDTSDDSICLQSSREDRPVENVVITNCLFTSKWAGLRFGLLACGDIKFVTVTSCVFRQIQDSGIKIQAGEGGTLSHMLFADLVMEGVPRPVFMTLCDIQACVDKPVINHRSAIRHMTFRNIMADSTNLLPMVKPVDAGFIFMGLPDLPLEDITVSDINFIAAGGADDEDATGLLPDFTTELLDGWWPEYHLFGRTIPASGLYASHVKGFTMKDLNLSTALPDARKPVVLHNVE